MTSEFLPGAPRAQQLVDELLKMVAEVREQAAALERERDALRRELESAVVAVTDDPAAPTSAPPGAAQAREEGRVNRGELRRALAPALGAPARRRGPLMALLGGEDA